MFTPFLRDLTLDCYALKGVGLKGVGLEGVGLEGSLCKFQEGSYLKLMRAFVDAPCAASSKGLLSLHRAV